MVDFVRAKTGAAHRRFPDIDNCGYRDEAHPAEHGPIVSAMVSQKRVSVRFIRTEISKSAKLFAVSTNPTVVKITNPAAGQPLSSNRSHDIEFSALARGRSAIEIRYKWEDGPVIGRIYVESYGRIRLRMLIHMLTVNGLGQPNNFLSKACASPAQREARIREFVSRANEGWIPHGIVLTITGFINTVWGAAQIPSGAQSPTVGEMLRAGMNSPNRSATDVNVFVVPSVANIMPGVVISGAGVSTDMARRRGLVSPAVPPPPPAVQHFGSGLYLHASSDATPQTIQHEMGHYMSLVGLPNQGHSTGDLDVPAGTHTRDDLVSRRRVMYPVIRLENGAPSTWRNNTGYGPHVKGSFVTYRRLPPAQDYTFEESLRARTATTVPRFYAP